VAQGLRSSLAEGERVGSSGIHAIGPRQKLQPIALGQKIEAVEGIVPVRLSLVARCAAIGLMQLRIADLPIFVLGCCELHSQKQAQLKVGAFEPQPSVYQN
jgi:hypothetical protein